MRPRLSVLAALAAALVALAVPAAASAFTVHVRVEGLNSNIFGAAEPRLTPYVGPVVADDGSVQSLKKPTALGALEAASRKAEFYYRLRAASFGLYVDRIGRYPAAKSSGWVFKVNGVSPPVGAADYVLKPGDSVLWYFARFGPTGGPATLELRRRAGGCAVALAVDDAGKAAPARNVVFRVDYHRVRDADGVICSRGWHRLRVTKPGAVPSAVLHRR